MKMISNKLQQNNATLLHLSLIPQVGPATVISLIQSLGTRDQRLSSRDLWYAWDDLDLTQLYRFTELDCQDLAGLTPKTAALIVEGLANKKILADEVALLESHPNIRYFTILDDEYPQLLRHINVPPMLLYARGAPLVQDICRLAIVGSRASGTYAQTVIAGLVPEFVAHGWEIVSGGALGVDGAAHAQTMKSGGKTLVVLGSGLLELYPAANIPLCNAIAQGHGTLLSPFPLAKKPEKGTFPARNRIIAGLSLGTLVVQAAEKSGALITAHYALEQGRHVFAVPGLVTDPLSVGCHNLIKQGAKLVGSVQDILEEFGSLIEQKVFEQQESLLFMPAKIFDSEKVGGTGSAVQIEAAQARDLPERQRFILQHLAVFKSLDELHEVTKIPFFDLKNDLFDLQLEGIVAQNHAGLWGFCKAGA